MWDQPGSKVYKVRVQFPWTMRHFMNEVHFHYSQKVTLHNAEEPWVEVSMKEPIGEDLLDWVARWGDGVTVLSPPALKQRLFQYGEWLVETYG